MILMLMWCSKYRSASSFSAVPTKLDITEFKKRLLQVRGSTQASAKDSLDMRMFVDYEMETALELIQQAVLGGRSQQVD